MIELLHREMLKSSWDIKIEPQLVLALEKGLLYEDLMVSFDSLFYREYSKDVFMTELKEDVRKKKILQLHLSRSGIYDQLPEGLFFQPGEGGKHVSTPSEMAAEYRVNKQKEHDFRLFFQPFENDFLWQRVQIEMEETKLLEGLQSGELVDYFIEFWGLPVSIPKPFIVPLLILLPYAAKIVGNISLTTKCLQLLLQESVRIRKIPAPETNMQSHLKLNTGTQYLGVDMVCGEEFMEDYTLLEFTIGPLQSSQVADYLDGGNRFDFLQTFFAFFVPAFAGTTTLIEILAENQGMHIGPDSEPVLGYSSVF